MVKSREEAAHILGLRNNPYDFDHHNEGASDQWEAVKVTKERYDRLSPDKSHTSLNFEDFDANKTDLSAIIEKMEPGDYHGLVVVWKYGWAAHSISFNLIKDKNHTKNQAYLVIVNRGDKLFNSDELVAPNLMVFDIDTTKRHENNFLKLIGPAIESKKKSKIATAVQHLAYRYKRKFTENFEIKKQKVGNCAYANANIAWHFKLAGDYMKLHDCDFNTAYKATEKDYKKMRDEDRVAALKYILNNKDEFPSKKAFHYDFTQALMKCISKGYLNESSNNILLDEDILRKISNILHDEDYMKNLGVFTSEDKKAFIQGLPQHYDAIKKLYDNTPKNPYTDKNSEIPDSWKSNASSSSSSSSSIWDSFSADIKQNKILELKNECAIAYAEQSTESAQRAYHKLIREACRSRNPFAPQFSQTDSSNKLVRLLFKNKKIFEIFNINFYGFDREPVEDVINDALKLDEDEFVKHYFHNSQVEEKLLDKGGQSSNNSKPSSSSSSSLLESTVDTKIKSLSKLKLECLKAEGKKDTLVAYYTLIRAASNSISLPASESSSEGSVAELQHEFLNDEHFFKTFTINNGVPDGRYAEEVNRVMKDASNLSESEFIEQYSSSTPFPEHSS